MAVLLTPVVAAWRCRFCGLRDGGPRAARVRPGDRMVRLHRCAAQGGLLTPLAPPGRSAEVRAVMREDYEGGEDVQRDGHGRPVMAFYTLRDDGLDCAVLAPTAHLRLGDD
jgi:hypothetical protein